MSNAAKLKKKAVEFEQKKQYDKALALYVQVLEATAAGDAEPEVGLYNRVGDLLLRTGKPGDAVTYYRKAVELYVEGGFLNNAIALCNKILRQDPTQTEVHYTLGRISAQKGFRSDAKAHFLEYAQRMQRAGEMDESFRALKEFADLCPDQDDIRLMLAEQLSKQGRAEEAVEQLQTLHERFSADGRTVEARATAERLAAIDPTAEPRMGTPSAVPKASGGLVFLDVSWEEPRAGASAAATTPAAAPLAGLDTVAPVVPPPASTVASILDPDDAARPAPPSADAPVAGLETTALELEPPVEAPSLVLDAQPAQNDEFGLRDFAPLPDLVAPPAPDAPAVELPILLPDLGAPADDEPMEVEGSAGPELTFIMPDEADDAGRAVDSSDPAPLPLLELEPPAFVADPPRVAEPTRRDDAARPAASNGAPAGNDAPSDAFVNLGDWLRDDEGPKSTRMVVDAVEPAEGEEFDFDDMLRKFKRGVADNVDEDDHESHYDLGIAFREMGLVDEAISEFQKALRGQKQRVRTYEALGQCFVDKGQHQVAMSVLGRAAAESPADDQLLVGVLYLLGVSTEALGRSDDAIAFYQRVFAVDINFRDVEDRLSALERTT
jgi:tetratricopeptide (TPR) repeat protein